MKVVVDTAGNKIFLPDVELTKLEDLIKPLESRAQQALSGGNKVEQLSGIITGSFFGKTEQQIKRHLPKDWTIKSARGNGWVAKDASGNERIRFMRPVSETVTKWERQKNGYWIRQNADGKFLDEAGKVIPDTLSLDEIRWRSHIPYTGVRR